MKLRAKHTIDGLKPGREKISEGEIFEAGEEVGARLIELDAAEEVEKKENIVNAASGQAAPGAEVNSWALAFARRQAAPEPPAKPVRKSGGKAQ